MCYGVAWGERATVSNNSFFSHFLCEWESNNIFDIWSLNGFNISCCHLPPSSLCLLSMKKKNLSLIFQNFIYFSLLWAVVICSPNVSQVSLETSAQRIPFGGWELIQCSAPSSHHIPSSVHIAHTRLSVQQSYIFSFLCDKTQ